MTNETPKPTPKPVETYEDYRDRKRLERAERLDKFEQDSDSRYNPRPWP